MENSFYVEYANCPTSYNPTITLRVRDHELVTTLEIDRERVNLTKDTCIKFGVGPHLVLKVFRDVGDERQVFFEDRGFGKAYMGVLPAMLRKAPVEVLV